ncbi:hypothetical protein VIMS_05370 [Mycobacterium marinum]|nr:hypothetical protein VIMS_05370 [Mycobacterium marinum]
MGGFVGGDIGDGEVAASGGVDGVVLVDGQGVEESFVAAEVVDFGEGEVVVFEGGAVVVLELGDQFGGGGGGVHGGSDCHGVDQQAYE